MYTSHVKLSIYFLRYLSYNVRDMVDSDKQKKRDDGRNEEEAVITDNHTEAAYDDIDLSEIESSTANKIKTIQKKAQAAEQERRAAVEDLQRSKAEFLNTKKRLEEDVVTRLQREREDVIRSLLPVCDSFQMAMQNKEQWEQVDPVWRKGVEGIHAQLNSVLEQYAVSQINPINEVFDPNLHEAVDEEATDDATLHNTVSKVIQPGYKMERMNDNSTLLRPARVIVATASDTETNDDT